MANFPQEFAQSILALRQQRIQKDAELKELKRARQAQEQIEQSRVAAQSSAAFWQAQNQSKAIAAQEEVGKAQAAAQEAAASARIQIESKRIEEERRQATVKALQDFAVRGFGFIPTEGYEEFVKLRGTFAGSTAGTGISAQSFHEVPVPGLGIYVTRFDGAQSQAYEQTQLALQKAQQELALMDARKKEVEVRTAAHQSKIDLLGSNITASEANFANTGLQQLNEIVKTAVTAATAAGDMTRVRQLSADPTLAFDETQKRLWEDYSAVSVAFTKNVLSKGASPPTRSNPDVLRAAGVFESMTAAPAPGTAVQAPIAPSQAPGPTNQTIAQPTAQTGLRVSGRVSVTPRGSTATAGQFILEDRATGQSRVIDSDTLRGFERTFREFQEGTRDRDQAVVEAAQVIQAFLDSSGFTTSLSPEFQSNE